MGRIGATMGDMVAREIRYALCQLISLSSRLTTNAIMAASVVSIPSVLPAYNRSLHECKNIVDTLRSHTTTFEVSRDAISRWVEQPWLEEFGWDANWEELCAAEVEKWDS